MNSQEKLPSWTQALGHAVRARRKHLGITQQDLAGLAGCGPVFIYDLERGAKRTLRLDKLVDVLHVLGLQLTLEPGHQGLRVAEPLG